MCTCFRPTSANFISSNPVWHAYKGSGSTTHPYIQCCTPSRQQEQANAAFSDYFSGLGKALGRKNE